MAITQRYAQPATGYSAQLDGLRSVTKWLVAAFAAVGALLVAGLTISDLGTLQPTSWRLYTAIGAVLLALTAVVFIIQQASTVLSHEWLTLASFGGQGDRLAFEHKSRKAKRHAALLRAIDDKLTVSSHELFGYVAPTRAQLHRRLSEADERILSSRPGSRRALRYAHEAATLREAARDTVQYANYYYTLQLFQSMCKRLGWAALVVAISIAVYAYAVDVPKSTPAKPATSVASVASASPGHSGSQQ